MDMGNVTAGFILLGLFNHTRAHLALFVLVLTVALNSVVGNALLLLLIHQDCRLHTPMYYFLSQLSLMDMMLVCTIVPQMAAHYLTGKKSISAAGCGFQIFFFLTMEGGECFILAAMSYDRYVAICHPLRYPVLMSWQLSLRLILGSWFLGATDGAMQAAATLSFKFCGGNEIDHFFCEAPVLLRLACGNKAAFEFFMYICCVLMLLIPLCLILTSYGLILTTILQMRSTEARKKAFATCSSHLAVVALFYGAAIFIYMKPTSSRSANHDKIVSAFYTIVTPMLNPLIYSLRNSEVKGSLRKCVSCCAPLTGKDALVCLDFGGCTKRKGIQ